ncbi:MAG: peptidoglycan editing factor PgeF [Eggerthellaceae bacterium]|nr:peptidoglycan editing factor PgeF [Eggerthellaceae bacterium]
MRILPIESLDATGLVRTACTALGEGPWSYGEEGATENFEALAEAIGVRDAHHMVRVNQKHTANIRVATIDDGGRGIYYQHIEAPRAFESASFDFRLGDGIDGLITNTPGLTLCTTEADCVPVFLLDPVTRSIGMIHSGWRGTAALISKRAISLMTSYFGANPRDIIAVLGPCICKDCYEVGPELVGDFEIFFAPERIEEIFMPHGDGKYLLDVPSAVRMTLQDCGVREENITMPFECTCHGAHFSSYRRDHIPHDRMLTAIVLAESHDSSMC